MAPQISRVNRPNLSDLATGGLGWKSVPSDPSVLRAAVIGEAIRTALYLMCRSPNGLTPIHNLELRNWISHKLGVIIPDLLAEDESGYRDVLVEGRGANLEFLGDALVLSNGFIAPAPTRLVALGGDSHLLISGTPTAYLGDLQNQVVHTCLGRRVDKLPTEMILKGAVRTQSLGEYLGVPGGLPQPKDLMTNSIRSSATAWNPAADWEVYLGNLEPGEARPTGRFGFVWTEAEGARAKKAPILHLGGFEITLWRSPLYGSKEVFSHWVRISGRGGSTVRSIDIRLWKQMCLAFDFLMGSPRHATIAGVPKSGDVSLSMGFPPFEALAKVLHASGATTSPARQGLTPWSVPEPAAQSLKGLLENAGVVVRTLGVTT